MSYKKSLESRSISDLVGESELEKQFDDKRAHEYNLNDKTAKSKLLKSAKRSPLELTDNKSSSNLTFSVGAWNHVVLPSVRYWNSVKGEKSCIADKVEISIASVDMGRDAGGLHVDTKVVFYANRSKIVCHFYNTTQRILINGHGYEMLVKTFLKPYFEAKINLNNQEIVNFNKMVMENLGSKQVKRSSVKYKQGSIYPCKVCDFATMSLRSLTKHKASHYNSSFNASSLISSSTRNNSISEALLQENLTIANITNESVKAITLQQQEKMIDENLTIANITNESVKSITLQEEENMIDESGPNQITCDRETCDYKSSDKTMLKKHIGKHLGQPDVFECKKCGYEGENLPNLEEHLKLMHSNNYKCEICDYTPPLNREKL